jgi:protocatechuate 3,4-dioxygenase beta subunit
MDSARTILSDASEPGDRLVFFGRVLDYRGQPLSKAAVVAYHADHRGLYNPPNAASRTPRLRAVAVTDDNGEFRFSTVRPGPYPDGSEPAHIHLAAVAPAHHLRYVTYWFEGDPLITPEQRRRRATDPELVIVELKHGADGVWFFSHDIRLEGN